MATPVFGLNKAHKSSEKSHVAHPRRDYTTQWWPIWRLPFGCSRTPGQACAEITPRTIHIPSSSPRSSHVAASSPYKAQSSHVVEEESVTQIIQSEALKLSLGTRCVRRQRRRGEAPREETVSHGASMSDLLAGGRSVQFASIFLCETCTFSRG